MRNRNNKGRMTLDTKFIIALALVCLLGNLCCAKKAESRPRYDVTMDGDVDTLDLSKAIDTSATLTGEIAKSFRKLVHAHDAQVNTFPTAGTFVATDGTAQIQAATGTLHATNSNLEKREVWFDRRSIKPSDIPTDPTLVAITFRVLSGGVLPDPTNLTKTLGQNAETDWTDKGITGGMARGWLWANKDANQVTVAWRAVYKSYTNGHATYTDVNVAPRDANNQPSSTTTFNIKQIVTNFTATNIGGIPATITEGDTITPTVTVNWTTAADVTATFVETVQGTVNDGGRSILARAGTSSAVVVMPKFMAARNQTNVTIEVQIPGSVNEPNKLDNIVTRNFVVQPKPAEPTPDLRLVSMSFSPGTPAPGGNVNATVVYGISRTTPSTFTFTAKDMNATVGTFTGNAPAGNTTAAFNVNLGATTGGLHTVVGSITFSPATTEVTLSNNNLTATYSATLAAISITGVSMPLTGTAGNPASATIAVRNMNGGGPLAIAIEARQNGPNGPIIGNTTVVLPAGSDTTTPAQMSVQAIAGTTSAWFRVDPANTIPEANKADNLLVQPFTVSGPSAPLAPTNVRVTNVTSTSATVAWDVMQGAVDYMVTVSTPTTVLTTTGTSITVPNLTSGTQTTIRVSARNASQQASALSTSVDPVPGVGHYVHLEFTSTAAGIAVNGEERNGFSVANGYRFSERANGLHFLDMTDGLEFGGQRAFVVAYQGVGSALTYNQIRSVAIAGGITVRGINASSAVARACANTAGADLTQPSTGYTLFYGVQDNSLGNPRSGEVFTLQACP